MANPPNQSPATQHSTVPRISLIGSSPCRGELFHFHCPRDRIHRAGPRHTERRRAGSQVERGLRIEFATASRQVVRRMQTRNAQASIVQLLIQLLLVRKLRWPCLQHNGFRSHMSGVHADLGTLVNKSGHTSTAMRIARRAIRIHFLRIQ